MRARGRHDQAVGRISMKRRRKPVQREDYTHLQGNERKHPRGRSALEPFRKRQWQFEPTLGMQHLRFPQADRRQKQPATLRFRVERLAFHAG